MSTLLLIIHILTLPLVALSNIFSLDLIPNKHRYVPGTMTSMPITLVNKSNDSVEYEIAVSSMSNKIEIFHTNKLLKIKPNQKEIILLPIRINKDCPSGKHEIVLTVVKKKTTEHQIFTINIEVTKNNDLMITPLKTTDYIKAGDTINSIFSIKNLGNITQTIDLSSTNGYVLDNMKINLLPQEERLITVIKPTNQKEKHESQQFIDLHARRFTDNHDNKLSAYNHFTIIPINPAQLDAYRRWPIKASLSYINMKKFNMSSSGIQAEVSTKGSLTNNNNNMLDIHLITKNPVTFNSYSQYEMYYAKYHNNSISIHLGDQVFASSHLTEYSRFGRGLEFKYKIQNVEMGAFYVKPRFFQEIENEINLYSKVNINKKNRITLGYLHKKMKTDFISQSHLISQSIHLPYIEYSTDLLKYSNIEAEYSISKNDISYGSGYRLKTTTSFDNLFASFNYIHTSPTYYGYFRNTQNINGSISYSFNSKINISANHYQDAINYQRDTLLLAAPIFKNSHFGVNYIYSKKGNINIYSGYMSSVDRLELNLFRYKELYTRADLNYRIGLFQFNLNNHYGYTTNQKTNVKGNSSYNQLNITYNKKTTNLSLFASVANTNRYDLKKTKNFYYGGRVSKLLFKETSVNIFYQSNYLPEEYFSDRNQFEGIIKHSFNKNHALQFSGRYMLQRGTIAHKDFILNLKYIAQINIPTKKLIDYSSLEGKILDADDSGLEGVKIQLGSHTAITNKEGFYKFKNIVPGEYYFDIDRVHLPDNTVIKTELTNKVKIEPINTNIQNIELTKAAKIRGNLVFKTKDYQNLTVQDDIENYSLIIEVSDGRQTLRKICKINELFEFKHLRPGNWKVKIQAGTLGNTLKIQKEYFEYELKPEQEQILDIDIQVIQKEIRYQQESLKVGYIEKS